MSVDSERDRRQTKRMIAVLLTACIFFWLFFRSPFPEPWSWLVLALAIGLYAAGIAMLVRMVRRQRDEDFPERGTDPRFPDS